MDVVWIAGGVAALAVLGLLAYVAARGGRAGRASRRRTTVPGRAAIAGAAAPAKASDGATRRAAAAGARTRAAAGAAQAPLGAAPAAGPAPLRSWLDAAELPPELAAWRPVAADELPPQQLQGIVDTFRDVPRPPRLLSRLASMDLLNAASSGELVALITGEPLIAARVLAAVNAPAYGLAQPVAGVGQAVTYLGLNRVRAICMQYALQQGFQADSPERAERLKDLWQAGALAGELVQLGAQRAALADPGGLTSAVLLSFLGDLAVAVAVARPLLAQIPAGGHLARCQAQQALLGLGAGEIGRLLMQQWELPTSVIDAVAAVDQRLYLGHSPRGDEATLREAFGYLCARLGERLARREIAGVAAFDLATDTDPALALVRPLAQDARFAALLDALRAPQALARIEALLGDRQVPAPAPRTPRSP